MKKRRLKMDSQPKGSAIELLGEGNQCLVAGTHSSGVRYLWDGGLPDSIPTLTLTAVDQIWSTLTTSYAKSTPTPAVATVAEKGSADQTTEVMTKISEEDWHYLIECLRFLVPHAADEQVWAEIGMALLSIKDCGKPVEQLWLDFSKKAPNWQEGAAEQWWGSHVR